MGGAPPFFSVGGCCWLPGGGWGGGGGGGRRPGGPFRAGDTIYVALTPTPMAGWPSPLALPTSLSTTHPGSLAIRGKVVRARSGGLEAEYGIESFFVPQGRGREIERAVTRLSAEVAVDRQGRAVIRRLFIGNTPFP